MVRCIAVQDIDFATIHSWADNWLDDTTAFQTRWLQQHDTDALNVLKKPVRVILLLSAPAILAALVDHCQWLFTTVSLGKRVLCVHRERDPVCGYCAQYQGGL